MPDGDALALATQLVQQAPALEPGAVAALRAALAADGSPLATSIARVLDGVVAGAIDAGVALPELAEACATLAHTDTVARDAARFRIETLLPSARAEGAPDREIASAGEAGVRFDVSADRLRGRR